MKLPAACFLLALSFGGPAAAEPPRRMALTFDDLPYTRPREADTVAQGERVTRELLRVLAAHRAPAVGFVNEGKLQVEGQVDARIALLQQWVSAGHLLGNHTYSHPDLNRLSVAEYQDEIVRGDVVTRRLMRPREPYTLYFRHPMTHTGDTAEKKAAIDAFLASRGYRITPHTIENADYLFNVVYLRALRTNDAALAAKVKAAYLDFTEATTAFAEQIAPKIFGREVPQTLLLHANDLNADCLDEMLTRLARRGYQFVTLDEVMADPAYATPDTHVSSHGPTWLFRWMKSLGQNVSFRDDPEPPAWVTGE